MKIRLVLLVLLLAVMLSACSYWVVEDAPIRVGNVAAARMFLH